MKTLMTMLVLVLSIQCALGQSQSGGAVPPVPVMNFQETLWEDFWSDEFVDGVDILVSSDLISSSEHTIYRSEWDEPASVFTVAELAGTLSDVATWDMSWNHYEVDTTTAVGTDSSGAPWVWDATTTLESRTFSAVISNGHGLSRYVHGIVMSIQIQWSPAFDNHYHEYQCWIPLGRSKSLADASVYAESFANSNVPPEMRVDTQDDCETLFANRMGPVSLAYNQDLLDCTGLGTFLDGALGGLIDGAGVGLVTCGGVGWCFAGLPGAATGGTLGGIVGGVVGGVGGGATAESRCEGKAFDEYATEAARLIRCRDECRDLGEWYCP